jgi:hypothetical protein
LVPAVACAKSSHIQPSSLSALSYLKPRNCVVASSVESCKRNTQTANPRGKPMRLGLPLLLVVLLSAGGAAAQEDKKTDDLKPADPDTGESTVEETTLGLLPNPLQRWGVKFAATYIGEVLGNPSGGAKQGSIYEGRLNLAVDVDLEKLVGMRQLAFHANLFQIHGGGLSRGALLNFLDVSGIEALPRGFTRCGSSRSGAPSWPCAPGSLPPTRNS